MSTTRQIPAGGPEKQVTSSGGSGQQNRIRTTEALWDRIEKRRPGLMKRLYDDLVDSLTDGVTGWSLLGNIRGNREENLILANLVGETDDNFTEKINAVFLNCFDKPQNTTTTEFGPYEPIYVRLAATDIDEASSGSDSGFESATGFDSEYNLEFDGKDVTMGGLKEEEKNPIAQKKALQVVLALNHFINERPELEKDNPFSFRLEEATSELTTTVNLYTKIATVFNNLFHFFNVLAGIRVKAAMKHRLPQGGEFDFGVLVSGSMTSEGRLQSVTEYPVIVELKRPNAGFGLAWKLLNGQGWTPEERTAFFKLNDLSLDTFDIEEEDQIEDLKDTLHSWQKDTAGWDAAKAVLDQVGTRRVEVKYSLSVDTAEHKQSNKKLECSYYVRARDGRLEDITRQLDDAKFKDCFDICHEALADVTAYGVLNNCTRVAIADGLTVIAGSLQKVDKSGAFYSSGSEEVFDVHLHDTAMLQIHDKYSGIYMLEYLSEATMCNAMLRAVGDYLITATDDEYQDGEITGAHSKEVRQRVKKHEFNFNSENHSSRDLTLVECSKLLAVKARGQVLQALADFDVHFSGIKSKVAQFTSETFVVCEWFRENAFEGAETSEPWHGRSKSVARVMKKNDRDDRLYVLKEYFSDEISVSSMSQELEAYARIFKLPSDKRKHVAELVSFGSLDLDTGNPRLYLLLEYVEDYDTSAFDNARKGVEVEKVDDIMRSVGVCHNDLEDRNYRWQCDSEGRWYIKVFDFDHATFVQENRNV